jgi:hypothetical protein
VNHAGALGVSMEAGWYRRVGPTIWPVRMR